MNLSAKFNATTGLSYLRNRMTKWAGCEFINRNSKFKIQNSYIHCPDPLGYLDFLQLMSNAKLVLTDSGGIQEETTILGIPCVTIRENTERPIGRKNPEGHS
jgi:UDP-N-acetylglucosamine 2-epimerase